MGPFSFIAYILFDKLTLATFVVSALALFLKSIYQLSPLAVRHSNTAATVKMKSWVVVKNSDKPSEALELKDDGKPTDVASLPAPGGSNILVRVAYASLNPADLHFMMKIPSWVPFRRRPTPAIDFSGTIVAAGPGVAKAKSHTKAPLAVGTAVAGCMSVPYVATGNGGLSEFVTVPAEMVARQPDKIDALTASGLLGCAGQTAALCANDGLAEAALATAQAEKRQMRVLINGASGSVGSLLIQIHKDHSRGPAHVTGVCSGKNADFVKGLGADDTIDYSKHASLPQYLTATYKDKPFDLIFDCVGDQSLFQESVGYLHPKGAVLCIVGGASQGILPVIRNNLVPTFLGGTPRQYKLLALAPSGVQARRVAEMVLDGILTKMPIDSVWPMSDVVQAYEKLATKRARGKIVVKVDASAKDPVKE